MCLPCQAAEVTVQLEVVVLVLYGIRKHSQRILYLIQFSHPSPNDEKSNEQIQNNVFVVFSPRLKQFLLNACSGITRTSSLRMV